MQPKEGGGTCPHCGFDAETYEAAPHHLPPETVLNGKYLVGRVLGEGGFGITYLGWDLNLQLKVAIKEYYPNGFVTRGSRDGHSITVLTGQRSEFFRKGMEKFVDEARRLAKFWGLPGIVAVKDYFQENQTAYIVMEFAEGKTLKTVLEEKGGRMEAQAVFGMMRPVMDSLETVHNAGLIHRDISPDNLMTDGKGHVKLIDFGAARDFLSDGEKSLSVMLKPGYSPEEQYRSRGQQGPWTDVYGLCATMYRMITGEVPLESLDRMEEDTLRAPSEMGVSISAAQEAALMKGLAIYKKDRYQSIGELKAALYAEENQEDRQREEQGHEEKQKSEEEQKRGKKQKPEKEPKPKKKQKCREEEKRKTGKFKLWRHTKPEETAAAKKKKKDRAGQMIITCLFGMICFAVVFVLIVNDAGDSNRTSGVIGYEMCALAGCVGFLYSLSRIIPGKIWRRILTAAAVGVLCYLCVAYYILDTSIYLWEFEAEELFRYRERPEVLFYDSSEKGALYGAVYSWNIFELAGTGAYLSELTDVSRWLLTGESILWAGLVIIKEFTAFFHNCERWKRLLFLAAFIAFMIPGVLVFAALCLESSRSVDISVYTAFIVHALALALPVGQEWKHCKMAES